MAAFLLSLGGCIAPATSEPLPHDDDVGGGGHGGGETTGPAPVITSGVGGVGGSGGSAEPGPSAIADEGAIEGERIADDGDNDVSAAVGVDDILRVDSREGEHLGFYLDFDAAVGGVELEVVRWDGVEAVPIGLTNGGAGLRTLAAFDPEGPRTYWVRVRATEEPFDGVLTVTRTPFEDGPVCSDDCAVLLQLPLPNDVPVDGYAWSSGTIFRYQFGRRDMLMSLRYAARKMADEGRTPIYIGDLSQWNGETPGVDVGSPRHASHQRGKDVDISLYGTDGQSIWRSYCEATYTSDGRECIAGTESGFDGEANAEMFGAMLTSTRVTMSFLDRELIPYLRDGADEASGADLIDPSLLPLYNDGKHVQHWPNHDNHIHVRFSEEEYGTAMLAPAPFEAP